jgi:hypothetical protein
VKTVVAIDSAKRAPKLRVVVVVVDVELFELDCCRTAVFVVSADVEFRTCAFESDLAVAELPDVPVVPAAMASRSASV